MFYEITPEAEIWAWLCHFLEKNMEKDEQIKLYNKMNPCCQAVHCQK